jgi:phage-related protein
MQLPAPRKPVHFVASSLKDLQALPGAVQDDFGRWLLDVQYGDTPAVAKPLKGFSGSGVLELIEDHDTNTYRAVYTVKFAGAVYVLHVFQKKSKSGVATPQHEIELVRRRLEIARQHYQQHYGAAEA